MENTLRVALCFLDAENKPVIVRALESNWTIETDHDIRVIEDSYREKIQDEVAKILADQIKVSIKEEILLDMLKELEKIGGKK